jgi:hypothetical protein
MIYGISTWMLTISGGSVWKDDIVFRKITKFSEIVKMIEKTTRFLYKS